MEDLYTDIKGIEKVGVVVYTVTKTRTAKSIIETTLGKVLAEPILDFISGSVVDIVNAPPRETSVYLCTEKWFDNFCKFASRSSYRSKAYTERCMLFNLLYTNHEGFDWEDIPVYKDDKPQSECRYERDKVYSIRIVSEEKKDNEKKCMEDIIMYVPTPLLNVV